MILVCRVDGARIFVSTPASCKYCHPRTTCAWVARPAQLDSEIEYREERLARRVKPADEKLLLRRIAPTLFIDKCAVCLDYVSDHLGGATVLFAELNSPLEKINAAQCRLPTLPKERHWAIGICGKEAVHSCSSVSSLFAASFGCRGVLSRGRSNTNSPVTRRPCRFCDDGDGQPCLSMHQVCHQPLRQFIGDHITLRLNHCHKDVLANLLSRDNLFFRDNNSHLQFTQGSSNEFTKSRSGEISEKTLGLSKSIHRRLLRSASSLMVMILRSLA